MKRRHFLTSIGLLSTLGLSWTLLRGINSEESSLSQGLSGAKYLSGEKLGILDGSSKENFSLKADFRNNMSDLQIKDQLYRVAHFDEDFPDDIFLAQKDQILLVQVVARMKRMQQLVGHGNFCVLGFDEMLQYAKNYSKVGEFSKNEITFFERVFFHNAKEYGFMGKKIITSMTEQVNRKDGIKISGSGNYLFKGKPLDTYYKLKKDIGDNLILTSGIRSIVKQMYLFLAKVEGSMGNLSKASRSLAPPGHSYHAVGDFDVGNIGMGEMNFTEQFAETEEFRQLVKLGYISIRYTQNNYFGVRYEPWHIKVV